MKTLSRDTHPEAENVLIGLIRQASVAKRISRMHSLTRTILRLSKLGIAKAHPELSQQEVNLLFVKLHYGDELAHRLHTYLEHKHPHGTR